MRLIKLSGVMGCFVMSSVGDDVTAQDRSSRMKSQLSLLDERAADHASATVTLDAPTIEIPGTPNVGPDYSGPYAGPLLDLARAAARRHQIPEELFLRLIQQESGWNPNARSHKGAIGLTQLMPGTADYLGVDPHDVEQNIEGGARYLKEQQQEFRSWMLALAAYNAGPGAVRQYGGVPPYRETRTYVRRIWGR
jgi:soluble lytic murein transglycosylase-like protein